MHLKSCWAALFQRFHQCLNASMQQWLLLTFHFVKVTSHLEILHYHNLVFNFLRVFGIAHVHLTTSIYRHCQYHIFNNFILTNTLFMTTITKMAIYCPQGSGTLRHQYTLLYSVILCFTPLYSALHRFTLLYSALLCSTLLYSALL